MGQNDLGGVQEEFSVHPLSREQARDAAERLADATVRWAKRTKLDPAGSRALFNFERALLMTGIVEHPSDRYVRSELGAALQRHNRKEKRC